MIFGVSTACLYPLETEMSLDILVGEGVKDVEIFFNSQREISADFVKNLRKTAGENGVRVHSIHPFSSGQEPFFLFSDYYRRFEDTLELYRRYAEAACELGAGYVVIHGDRLVKFKISDREYFERFDKLMEIGAQSGVMFAQENVANFRSSQPGFIAAMKKALPEAPFVFDIKQAVRSGVDPLDMLGVMGDNVRHIHISDHREGFDCTLPGEGGFDFAGMFNRLRATGYGGAIILEVYRGSFEKASELMRSVSTLKAQYDV